MVPPEGTAHFLQKEGKRTTPPPETEETARLPKTIVSEGRQRPNAECWPAVWHDQPYNTQTWDAWTWDPANPPA